MKQFHRGLVPQFNEKASFPAEVVRGEGMIESVLYDEGAHRAPFVFADEYVMKVYGAKIKKSNPSLASLKFSGSIDPGEFYRVKSTLAQAGSGLLVAMGGGKTMDLAKLVKRDMPSIKLINIPTSAATCAAMTPVAVMYDKQGVYMDTLDAAVPDTVVIDYCVMDALPSGFFAAGACDAAAKYFETLAAAKKLKKSLTPVDTACLAMAADNFKRIKDMAFLKWSRLDSTAKRELAEINIVLSGMVSCLGVSTITALTAHAAAHAFTASPGARQYLHGEHMAPALLLQEEMLKNTKNSTLLASMFECMELGVSLSQIGVKKQDLKDVFALYEKIEIREKISVYSGKKPVYNDFERFL
ncbi:MAG: iron-containing alcohol dehydrogenase [Spirochaetia bacterium]|nr:iron-containing alcohol dehydrogenase [Spirochaetia bacterium]